MNQYAILDTSDAFADVDAPSKLTTSRCLTGREWVPRMWLESKPPPIGISFALLLKT